MSLRCRDDVWLNSPKPNVEVEVAVDVREIAVRARYRRRE